MVVAFVLALIVTGEKFAGNDFGIRKSNEVLATDLPGVDHRGFIYWQILIRQNLQLMLAHVSPDRSLPSRLK